MTRKWAGILVACLIAGALLFYFYGGHQTPASQPPLTELQPQNVGVIASAFNAAKGDVRLLLLLSPT